MTANTPEPTGQERALLSVEEAAEALGVSRTTMYGLIRDSEIQTVRVGRRRLVPAEEIAAYIARATAKAMGLTEQPSTVEDQPTSETTLNRMADGEDAPEPMQRRRRRPKGTRAPNGASSIYLGKNGKWHGRVTMGIRDDGTPDRRHIERKTEAEVIKAVRELEKQRDSGIIKKAGPVWTVEKWLTHWIEHIAPTTTGKNGNGLSAYEVAVRIHLVPGLGRHRLDRIQPEHFERFYAKMIARGKAPATAHQVHRTARTAFGEAHRRGLIVRNPVALARPPRVDAVEIVPYTVEEIRVILVEAAQLRNSARWAIALALGLRQGEALGLKWADVDLDRQELSVWRGRLRPKYKHGCADGACGHKFGGHCPERVALRKETGDTKSEAGKRTMALPDELVELLKLHQEAQNRERSAAGDQWQNKGYVFASETGEPLNPRSDYTRWKDLLAAAGVRDGRLHDARHTAATVLLMLKVPERVVMALMGWSTAAMAARYQHVTGEIRKDVADEVGGLIWKAVREQSEQPTNEEADTPARDEEGEEHDTPDDAQSAD